MAVGRNSRTPINRYGVTNLTLRHQVFHNIGNLVNRHRMFYRPLPLETAMTRSFHPPLYTAIAASLLAFLLADVFTPADETHAGTLSIWEDIESVHNFTYSGLHGIAFKQRHKWFRDIDYPTHVMWWINRGETPSWKQSVARFDSLYANGPTSFAFNFQHVFDSAGNPLTGFEPAR